MPRRRIRQRDKARLPENAHSFLYGKLFLYIHFWIGGPVSCRFPAFAFISDMLY